MANETGTYHLRCHCGRISARFRCNRHSVTAWDCNCSDCAMRRNVHFVIPAEDLTLTMEGETLEDATILYEWGTRAAKRRFCRTCGILPFYIPRSNPDGVAITLRCADFGPEGEGPTVVVKKFDGVHWEESHAKTGIAAESKRSGN
uniref:CENP-V/GFA domain-containing protein n=1 Tax=Odontella aurita TaxID=265563 RepID=A0A7S4J2W6_9STRA